jgi:hypothetical protein
MVEASTECRQRSIEYLCSLEEGDRHQYKIKVDVDYTTRDQSKYLGTGQLVNVMQESIVFFDDRADFRKSCLFDVKRVTARERAA